MSKAKSERLVNLLIMMLSARGFVSKHRIRSTIEGYRHQGDAAFERMFERDKDELRAAGVPIVTGSNERDLDTEDGYRIERSDFELPPVSFTPEELAVLGAAASVWQDSVAAQQTTDALETLRAAGADPDPGRLLTLRPRIPAEPGFDAAREALLVRRAIAFEYKGQGRRVQPWRLSQRRGRWYMVGYDLDRQAPRNFKLSRVTSEINAVGPLDAYAIPTESHISQHVRFDRDGETATAVVALRDGFGGDLRRSAQPIAWEGSLPDGFSAWQVESSRPDILVGDICELGADAICLNPPELRDAVVRQLRIVEKRWGA
ncbi:MAG: helix-turn-helix transcriptional regulator [Arachnia sp.]